MSEKTSNPPPIQPMPNPVVLTETGCYLDNHRGHFITRDAIELACSFGFIVGGFERFALDHYDDLGHEEDYPQEDLYDLQREAEDWLNSSATEREISGQNLPPARPAGFYWGFNDGDYGLYSEDSEDF